MKKSGILMIIGSLSLIGLFFLPLWSITLGAPQYPEPIGMHIWVNKIADKNPNDIKNINLMNHYVGMKQIPEHMAEFDLFPYVIGIMAGIGVVLGFLGKYKLFLVWFIVMALLGIAGMYDFYLWEYDYGHTLSPKAAIKFVDDLGKPLAYQPPMFGTKVILNFTATALPLAGAYVLFAGMMTTVLAFFVGKKESKT
ncbi:MAG TPA: hypothetical protein ENJ82_08130 [Bacteroidetes bacterium]|nr:hypothetical protein [Bacteroidota bacterium]